jgi:hypothetical protein
LRERRGDTATGKFKKFGIRLYAQNCRIGSPGGKTLKESVKAVAVKGRRTKVKGSVLDRDRVRRTFGAADGVYSGKKGFPIADEGPLHLKRLMA